MIPVLFSVSHHVAYCVFGAAFWCFRNIVWLYSVKAVNEAAVSPLRAFAVSQLMFSAAILLGSPLVRALASALHLGEIPWAPVSSAMVFLVFVAALALSYKAPFPLRNHKFRMGLTEAFV